MKKNLLFIINNLQVGGTQKHLAYILPQLAALGFRVSVLTLVEKGDLAPDLEKQGIPVYNLLSDRDINIIQFFPKLLGRFVRIIFLVRKMYLKSKQNPNAIVHYFSPESYIIGMLGALFARFSGPSILSRRTLKAYEGKREFIAWLEKKFYSKTAIITGNSQAVISELRAETQLPEDRLRLIYNGIDTTFFALTQQRQVVRTGLNIPSDALVLIKVANLISYKGHMDLLNALARIKEQLPNPWRLVCIGKGRGDGMDVVLQEHSHHLGLTEHILWLGARTDIPDLLGSADIGILCSHVEGFSNAVLEKMSSGLPMVVTDVGGNKEAVLDGETGTVVQPRNPDALAAAILALAQDPVVAEKFGKQGQLRIKEHFSLEACVQAYVNLYGSLET